jgi:hypothetical protein
VLPSDRLEVTAEALEPRFAVVATEFYRLYCEKEIWKPKEKRFDELTEIIRSWYPNLDALETAVVQGIGCEVQVGQKPIEKFWPSMSEVCKAAGGFRPFLRVCTVTLKALSGAIGKDKAESLQMEARTGKRRLVAVAVLSPAAEMKMAA